MKSPNDHSNPESAPAPESAQALRLRAEEQFRVRKDLRLEALGPEETGRLLHELRLHQIELEMQNEELRRAQEELEASRALYVDLYDFVPIGYVTVGETGLILGANLTAATLLGVSRDALTRQPLTRFILPGDWEIYNDHRKALSGTGVSQRCELRLLRPDGSSFWARLEATEAREGEGGLPVCRIVISDITERKKAEETLRESVAFNELLIQTIPFGMDVVDEQGRVLWMSPAMEATVGRKADGWNCWQLYKDDGQRCVDCPLNRPIRVGETITLESSGALGGRTFEITHTGILYRGQQAILEVFNDTTERKQVKDSLAKSEIRYRTLFESSTDAVMLLDESRFLDCNMATVHLFGCRDKAEFCTKHPADCSPALQPFGKDSLTSANRHIATALAEG